MDIHIRILVLFLDPILEYWNCSTNFVYFLENAGDTNKAGYTATEVSCGWAGAMFEVTRPFGQEQ